MSIINKKELYVFDIETELSETKRKDTKKTIKILLQQFLKYKCKVILIIMSLVINIGLALSTPLTLLKMFDVIVEGVIKPLYYGNQNVNLNIYKLASMILFLIIKHGVGSIVGYFQKYMVGTFAKGVLNSLKQEAKNKLSKLSIRSLNKEKRKQIQKSIFNDYETLHYGIREGFFKMITVTVKFLATFIILFRMHWLVCIITAISLLLVKLSQTKKFHTLTSKIIIINLHHGALKKTMQYIMTTVVCVVLFFLKGFPLRMKQIFFLIFNDVTHHFTEMSSFYISWSAIASSRHAFGVLSHIENSSKI